MSRWRVRKVPGWVPGQMMWQSEDTKGSSYRLTHDWETALHHADKKARTDETTTPRTPTSVEYQNPTTLAGFTLELDPHNDDIEFTHWSEHHGITTFLTVDDALALHQKLGTLLAHERKEP